MYKRMGCPTGPKTLVSRHSPLSEFESSSFWTFEQRCLLVSERVEARVGAIGPGRESLVILLELVAPLGHVAAQALSHRIETLAQRCDHGRVCGRRALR